MTPPNGPDQTIAREPFVCFFFGFQIRLDFLDPFFDLSKRACGNNVICCGGCSFASIWSMNSPAMFLEDVGNDSMALFLLGLFLLGFCDFTQRCFCRFCGMRVRGWFLRSTNHRRVDNSLYLARSSPKLPHDGCGRTLIPPPHAARPGERDAKGESPALGGWSVSLCTRLAEKHRGSGGK